MAQLDYRQIRQLKQQNKDSILFVRVGDFYEVFDDDAVTLSKELDLTLTGRSFPEMDTRVPMTGIPQHASENYMKTLVDKGYSIAVAEDLQHAAAVKNSAGQERVESADGMTIKSQVEGWPDWSTADLSGNTRKYAEWLISNGYENESDVKSAFYNRQTSNMSDDYRAEQNDNAAIGRVARKYITLKDTEREAEQEPVQTKPTVNVEIPKNLKSYLSYEFSSGGTTGQDYLTFQRVYINYLRKLAAANDWELAKTGKNHYEFSAFFKNATGKYVYMSISDVRFFPNEWHNNILVRTAQHEKDYTGGLNNHTSLPELASAIHGLFERQKESKLAKPVEPKKEKTFDEELKELSRYEAYQAIEADFVYGAITKEDYERERQALKEKFKAEDGVTIQSQIDDLTDNAETDLPNNANSAAEWLIQYGYANESDANTKTNNVVEDKKMSNIEDLMDDPLFGDNAESMESAGTGNAGADGEKAPRLTPEDYIRQADADYIAAMRDGRYAEIIDGIADFNYSVRNVMLIKSQMPGATKVMGLHSWNYQGRSVIGGEKSLKILAVTDNGEAAADSENGSAKNGKNYRMSYVFDVSQTSGKELKGKTCTPEIMDNYYEGIHRTIADMAKGYTFREGERGSINYDKKEVTIPQGLSREDELKAMIYAAARIRVEGKARENGEEISQGRGLFNAIESSAVAHITARRLGLGDYPLKQADFKEFDDDALMRLTTNLHYVKMGAQRITSGVERYVSEAKSTDALRAERAAQATATAATPNPVRQPVFAQKSVAEAGG